jgi:hypothetical protein
MFVSFVDSLYPLVVTGDVIGARDLLADLEGKELAEAKAWFAKATRWYRTIPEAAFRHGNESTADHECWVESHRVMALCAVELCGPVTAAKRVPWDEFWGHQHTVGDQLFLDAVCAKDPAWVADFVEAASHQSGRTLTQTLNRINSRIPVPCPTGPGCGPGWLGHQSAADLAQEMSVDPWMPEMLFHILDLGGAPGRNLLPEAIAILAARGLLDRSRVVAQVFGLLTSPQRPSSQEALIRILEALDLRDEERPGLDYVLGVMATSSGAVGKYFLPMAVRLVCSQEDLLQLTAVIAGRQEKGPKQHLMKELQGSLRSRFGDEAIIDALLVLGADEDAAFATAVTSALTKLGAALPPVEQQERLGLWDVEPTPLPEAERPVWQKWGRESWARLLNTQEPAEMSMHAALVSQLLVSLSERGEAAVASFRDPVLGVWSMGIMRMSRLTAAMSDLFVAGGLRLLWPVAMEVADRDARNAIQSAGCADFLRMLARFAPEVPSYEVPTGVARLAARKGSTKAQMEARALGAAIIGSDPESYPASVRTNPPVAPSRPYRGLWHPTAPDTQQDLKLPPLQNPDIRAMLAVAGHHYESAHYPFCHYPRDHKKARGYAWIAEMMLDETVRMVGEVGSDAMRAKLVDIQRRTQPVPIVLAIDLWASGNLTPEFFWRLATTAKTYYHESWDVPSPWGRVGDCPWFDRSLSQDPAVPVMLPSGLDSGGARLPFLRACELMLVADRSPVMLSTPVYYDGTLDLDSLLARLDRVHGPVALLDLMQALYRMRRCDPARATEVESGRWITDPALTTPAGDVSVDAGALVRQWVLAGGLSTEGLEHWTASAVSAAAPVPWSFAASAERSFERGVAGLDCLRMMPLVPDLVVPIRTQVEFERFPVGSHGPWGPRMHDTAMEMIAEPALKEGVDWLPMLLRLVQTERLDPVLASRRGYIAGLQYGLERLFEAGGLAGAWPIALACAMVSLAEDPSSPYVGSFLAFLASYASEVPEPVIPEELRTFANEPGADAVHTQARLLVAALERS